MVRRLMKMHRDEKGITGLETAIILIAFVVVAAVFAYTTLSSGLFATQKSKQAVNSGIQETQSTMSLRGDVCAYSRDASKVGRIVFTVVNATANGEAIDLTPAYDYDGSTTVSDNGEMNKLQIAYSDTTVTVADAVWTVDWIGKHNDDYLLDANEQAVITVWLHSYSSSAWADGANPPYLAANYLTTYEQFNLQIKPSAGAVLVIERTIPAVLDTLMNLH